jgi:hypothetical protein
MNCKVYQEIANSQFSDEEMEREMKFAKRASQGGEEK